MDDESGKATKGEDVIGVEKGGSETGRQDYGWRNDMGNIA